MQYNILVLETAKIILSRENTSKMSDLEIHDRLDEIYDDIMRKLNKRLMELSANDIDIILGE